MAEWNEVVRIEQSEDCPPEFIYCIPGEITVNKGRWEQATEAEREELLQKALAVAGVFRIDLRAVGE